MSDWRYSVVSIVAGYCVVLVGHSCSTPPDCGSLPLLPLCLANAREQKSRPCREPNAAVMSSVRTEPGLGNDLARFIGSSI